MVVDAAFISVLVAALVGLALSVVLEHIMIPRPPLARPWGAWALHGGLWLVAYGGLGLLLGRPWFAVAGVSAFLLMLVLVNNAKVKALREPFVFQDYEYFTDAVRHPRLYIPFMGWGKFLGAATGFTLAVVVGLWGESVPISRFTWLGQLGGIAVVVCMGILCLLAGARKSLPVSFDPERDVCSLGLLASLWRYGEEGRKLPSVVLSFGSLVSEDPPSDLPHLVAVQSESFFDPRSLYPGIRADVLAEFDRLKTEAVACGKLKVPAWGANTVRTEFAFLSGVDDSELGVHRFNPYRAIAAGWDVPSLASFLKRLGYRTVCIHPYPASFYQRDRVYPRLGFDEFLDIETFDEAKCFGPYIGDAAVADKIAAVLNEATGPVFVFAITMENHGPLHLERVAPLDIDNLYTQPPPDGCEDLTVYLRHLRNADQMVAELHRMLERFSRPAALCWFGDHVPIMPTVYETFGVPNGDVEYVFWSNRSNKCCVQSENAASNLSLCWLRAIGLIDT